MPPLLAHRAALSPRRAEPVVRNPPATARPATYAHATLAMRPVQSFKSLGGVTVSSLESVAGLAHLALRRVAALLYDLDRSVIDPILAVAARGARRALPLLSAARALAARCTAGVPRAGLAGGAGAGLYLCWYFATFGGRPRLSYRGDLARQRLLTLACPSLRRRYYPLLVAPLAHMQLGLMALHDLLCVLLPPPYERQVVRLRDGQAVALDWRLPRGGAAEGGRRKPVVLLHHGAFQSSRSGPMAAMSGALAAAGFPVCIYNRRGYQLPLTEPRLDMFGTMRDVEDVLRRGILQKFPGRKLVVVGFSCGTALTFQHLASAEGRAFSAPENAESDAFSAPESAQNGALFAAGDARSDPFMGAGRAESGASAAAENARNDASFAARNAQQNALSAAEGAQSGARSARGRAQSAADAAASEATRWPQVVAGVVWDAGFDMSDTGALSRMKWPCDVGVRVLVGYHYAFKHRAVLARSPSKKALLDDLTLQLTPDGRSLRAAEQAALSDKPQVATCQLARRLSDDFITDESFFEARSATIADVRVPTLVLSSRDDPVCVSANLDDRRREIEESPHVLLAELPHGGHGCKYGALGGSFAARVATEFVQAAWLQHLEEEERLRRVRSSDNLGAHWDAPQVPQLRRA